MRHTYYAADIDELIDCVQAYMGGGWSGLRDAIKHNDQKGRAMSEQEYDNSNRVALWKHPKAESGVYTGGGKQSGFEGVQIEYASLVTRTRSTEQGPIADFVWRTGEDKHYGCPIWKNDDGKFGGKTDTHWVNLYKNKNEKGPPYVVKFKPKAPPRESDDTVEQGDIPF